MAKVRATAKRALKEDPDCVHAFMVLGQTQNSLKKEVEFNEKAVAAGRRKFSGLIASIDPQGERGLWGFPETKPFLCAMQELAEKKRVLEDVDAANKLFEELMAINPADNQGIRYDLLASYLTDNEWDRAREILDRFSDDHGCTLLYSRLFLELGKLSEAAEEKLEAGMSMENPFDNLSKKSVSKARAAAKTAVETYPWAIGMLADMRLYLVEPLASYRYGAPSEALEYARLAVMGWLGTPVAVMWLLTETRGIIENEKCRQVAREYHADFFGACELINELPPFEELAFS